MWWTKERIRGFMKLLKRGGIIAQKALEEGEGDPEYWRYLIRDCRLRRVSLGNLYRLIRLDMLHVEGPLLDRPRCRCWIEPLDNPKG